MAKSAQLHNKTAKYILVAIILVAAAYGFGSWAIDNGNLILWVITIILLISALRNVFKAVFFKGSQHK